MIGSARQKEQLEKQRPSEINAEDDQTVENLNSYIESFNSTLGLVSEPTTEQVAAFGGSTKLALNDHNKSSSLNQNL